MPCRVTVVLNDGRRLIKERRDYEGFYTRPVSWDGAIRKFDILTGAHTDAALRRDIIDMVDDLEMFNIPDLMRHLARVQTGAVRNDDTMLVQV
jgi:2-methylcitrate dehydratase